MIQQAKFNIGDLVRHRRFDYRGVIFDIDPCFQLDPEWYEQVALSRPPKDAPWYHVLVDNATHTTYVAERNLELDFSTDAIDHPLIGDFFAGMESGKYKRLVPRN